VWSSTYVVDRYLQAIVPMMAAVTATVIVRAASLGWVSRAALAPLVALQIVWSGDAIFYTGADRLLPAINLIKSGYDGNAKKRFDSYRWDFVALSEALPKDAVVLLFSEQKNLGLDRRLLLDPPHSQSYVRYDDLKGPRALYDYYRSLGVTHLAWCTETVTFHSKQADVLFSEFVTNYGVNRRTFGPITVVEMPLAPPAPDGDYRVLSLRTAFGDGLYDLADLVVHEDLPEEHKHFPNPRVPAGAESADVVGLVRRARAVVRARDATLDAVVQAEIDGHFNKALQFKSGHDVWVRRGVP